MTLPEDLGPEQLGKWLLAAGLLLAGIGLVVLLLGRTGVFKLPGDVEFGGKNWRVYIPVASCILLSIILTLLFWIIGYFRR